MAEIKLNLACGHVILPKDEGWVNLDRIKGEGIDVSADVPPLPFDDEHFDHILASHFLEHVPRENGTFIELMNECWRVLKPGGTMSVECPLAGTTQFYQDPTHVNPLVPETFEYFTSKYAYLNYGIKVWGSAVPRVEGWVLRVELIK